MGAIDKTAEEQVKDTFVVVPLSLHVKPRAANGRKIVGQHRQFPRPAPV